MAPTAPMANILPISAGVKPRWPDRNGQSNGSQAPQMAYWRNIMVESWKLSPLESGFAEEVSELMRPDVLLVWYTENPFRKQACLTRLFGAGA